MTPETTEKAKSFRLRARLPRYVRSAALVVIGLTILVIIVGFYRERNRSPFRLKSEHTKLSTEVTAEVNGYQRVETDGNNRKYSIIAERAKMFSDNHQEFENVSFEFFGDDQSSDKLKAERGLFVPDSDKNFTAYLAGNVEIETRDALRVRTSNLVYTKQNDTAEADERVEFERENIKGSAFGASIQVGEKRLELFRDIEIEVDETGGMQGYNKASVKSGSAVFHQATGKLETGGGVTATLFGENKKTDLKSGRAIVVLEKFDGANSSFKSVEMFDNVWIELIENGARQYTVESGYARFDKPGERFDLRNAVRIVSGGEEPTELRGTEAMFEQRSGKVTVSGGFELSRGPNYLKGDSLNAILVNGGRIKEAIVTGSAYLRRSLPDKTTEVTASAVSSDFDDSQSPLRARAVGDPKVVHTPSQTTDYTQVVMTATTAMNVAFKTGLLHAISTDGRTTIRLDVPAGAADAANKQISADKVNVTFDDAGKFLTRAEAVGGGELLVQPLQASTANYRTTIYAPRFDCDFYPTGSNARTCTAARGTKTVREPTVAQPGRGTQTLIADELLAHFSEASKDIETMTANGSAKFSELERSATASTMSFSQADRTVRLRGGEPTTWDGRSRAKAREIDWNTAEERSYFRGGVSTTYYSKNSTDGTVPFGSSDKPVFATADNAEFDHKGLVGVYSGNARGWQENNYVRANRFTISQTDGRFFAEGAVQSVLYDTKQSRKGASGNVPVFVTSNSLTYIRDSHTLQYRQNVDIRQGTDRLTAESADVYLDDRNELVRSVAENKVVITQPGRRATGDWVQYTAADDTAIVRGNPARVEDSANGISEAGQFSVVLKDNRVLAEGRTKQNQASRMRSVYKVRASQ